MTGRPKQICTLTNWWTRQSHSQCTFRHRQSRYCAPERGIGSIGFHGGIAYARSFGFATIFDAQVRQICHSSVAATVHIEIAKRTPELRHTLTTFGVLPRHPKDRMLVGIKCDRSTVIFQIKLESFKMGAGTFRAHETKLHQLARRIVDEDE